MYIGGTAYSRAPGGYYVCHGAARACSHVCWFARGSTTKGNGVSLCHFGILTLTLPISLDCVGTSATFIDWLEDTHGEKASTKLWRWLDEYAAEISKKGAFCLLGTSSHSRKRMLTNSRLHGHYSDRRFRRFRRVSGC
jgi:hypothetical protein